MKRWIHSISTHNANTDFLEIAVDIFYSKPVEASSILDLNDSAFYDFEANLLTACEIHDFELEDSYQSNRKDSSSLYYIYTKTNEEGTKLRVFLKIRVSDHEVPDNLASRGSTYKQRDIKHIKEEASKLAREKYNQKRGYVGRRLDIVFDDNHYSSYEDALQDIEKLLDKFDPE